MKFRIIVPMFNSSSTIERCIESIKSQTHRDFEVVIVDDMSNDNSVDIALRSISGDNRFHLVRLDCKRFGGGARNRGMEYDIKSDYTLFIDSDDVYHSEKSIEHIAKEIESSSYADGVLCPYWVKSQSYINHLVFTSVDDFLLKNPCFAPWTICVKSNIIPRFSEFVLGYDDVMQHFRQFDMLNSLTFVKDVIVDYMDDGANSVWNDNEMNKTKTLGKIFSLLYTYNEACHEKFVKDSVSLAVKRHFIEAHRNEAEYYRRIFAQYIDVIIKRGCFAVDEIPENKL